MKKYYSGGKIPTNTVEDYIPEKPMALVILSYK